MRTLLLAAILASATPAMALEGWVDFPIGSVHNTDTVEIDGVDQDINNSNPGLGFTFAGVDRHTGKTEPNISYRIGGYHNSYYDTSYYAGINPHTNRHKTIMVGAILGVVSGYGKQEDTSNIIPIVVPHISFQTRYGRAELMYVHGKYAKAISLTVGFPFAF